MLSSLTSRALQMGELGSQSTLQRNTNRTGLVRGPVTGTYSRSRGSLGTNISVLSRGTLGRKKDVGF